MNDTTEAIEYLTRLRRSRDLPGGVRDTADRLARLQAQKWPASRSIHWGCDHDKHARRIARQQRGKAERRAARSNG